MKRRRLLAVLALLATQAQAGVLCDVFTDADDPGFTIKWSVGKPSPGYAVDSDTFVECFISGSELQYVQSKFSGIVLRNGAQSVFYTGDTARFILNNL